MWGLLAALVLLAPGSRALEAGDAAPERSRIAPLAAHSLLLDATRAGARTVAVGEHGHVLLSDDDGASWRQVVVPTRTTLTAVDFPTPETGYAVGHDAIILASRDGGETWTLQHADAELESPLLGVHFLDAQRGFAIGAYGLFLETDDGGASWRPRMLSDLDVHHNAIARNGAGQLFVVGEGGSAFRSEDEGQSWQPVEIPGAASLFGAIGLEGPELLVFGLRGRVFQTRDGGATFSAIPTDTEASLMGGGVGESGRLMLGGVTGVLLERPPGASQFTRLQRPDRMAVATITPLPGGRALLVGAFGVEDAQGLLGAP